MCEITQRIKLYINSLLSLPYIPGSHRHHRQWLANHTTVSLFLSIYTHRHLFYIHTHKPQCLNIYRPFKRNKTSGRWFTRSTSGEPFGRPIQHMMGHHENGIGREKCFKWKKKRAEGLLLALSDAQLLETCIDIYIYTSARRQNSLTNEPDRELHNLISLLYFSLLFALVPSN